MVGFAWLNRAWEALTRMEVRRNRRAREEAELAEARRLDAEEVGRRADERGRDADETARSANRPSA